MKDNENKEGLQKALKIMQDHSENIKKTFQNIRINVPQIKIPEFNFPDISKIESPDVIKERNAWQRHSEVMGVQDAILKIQAEVLNEQKSTSKMTLIILILTIVSIFISIFSLLKSFSII